MVVQQVGAGSSAAGNVAGDVSGVCTGSLTGRNGQRPDVAAGAVFDARRNHAEVAAIISREYPGSRPQAVVQATVLDQCLFRQYRLLGQPGHLPDGLLGVLALG